MQQYTSDQYNEIFDKLPQPIKDIVSDSASGEKVFAIAKKHRLQVDQFDTLNDLTADVMMGITPAKDFLENVKNELRIDPHEAALIVSDINDELFTPIRELMEKTFRGGAPYKPRTIATVDENDDEHLHLTKHDVLREIENPVEATTRVEIIESTPENKETEKEPEISTTKEVQVFEQELTGNKIEMRVVPSSKLKVESDVQIQKVEENKKPEETQRDTPIVPPSAKSITEMKLSSTTSIPETKKIIEEAKSEVPKPSTDPYREPIM